MLFLFWGPLKVVFCELLLQDPAPWGLVGTRAPTSVFQGGAGRRRGPVPVEYAWECRRRGPGRSVGGVFFRPSSEHGPCGLVIQLFPHLRPQLGIQRLEGGLDLFMTRAT